MPRRSKRANSAVNAGISLLLAATWRWAMTVWLPCRAAAGRGDRRFAAGARAAHRLAVRVGSGADLRSGVRCVPSGLRLEAGFAEHPRQAQGRQHAEVVPAPAHTAGIRLGGRHLGLGFPAQ
jgi:hypothetical protein